MAYMGGILSWLSLVYLIMSGGKERVMSCLLMLGGGPTDMRPLLRAHGPPAPPDISLKNSIVCIVILMLCSSCSRTCGSQKQSQPSEM